jgi:predicted nucleotidyltransferase
MNQQILEEIRQLKRRLITNERLILFGSQTRDNARPNSNWDLLVLLNKDKRDAIVQHRLQRAKDILLEENGLFSLIAPAEEFIKTVEELINKEK